MKDPIELYNFIKNNKIIHNHNIHSYKEGLAFLVQNQRTVDGITYYFTNQYSFMNIDVLKLNDIGQYYYEITPESIGDMIDEIKYESITNLDAKLIYYIDEIEYQPECFNEFLFVSAQYNNFKIRITFMRKPQLDDTFKINSRYWLFVRKAKLLLETYDTIITKYNIYNGGMCKINYM